MLSLVRIFVTLWIAAGQDSLSINKFWSLLKLMSIKSVIPSNHLIICHSLLLLLSIFPSIRVFPSESALQSGGQSIEVSASASVLPMNIQDWFPLGLTVLISLQSKELSRVFSNTTVQKHQFFSTQLSSRSYKLYLYIYISHINYIYLKLLILQCPNSSLSHFKNNFSF